MMWRRHLQGQRSALRELAEQLRREDPDLADLLANGLRTDRAIRGSGPGAQWFLAAGGVLLFLAGAYLSIASSAFLGAGMIAFAVVRYVRHMHRDTGSGLPDSQARSTE